MMGFRLSLAAVLMIAATAHAAGNADTCRFGRQTLPSVTCYGPASLNKTTVTSATQVEGDLKGTAVTLDSMTVDGAVDLHESTVKGLVAVFGNVNAHKVEFEKGLDATTDKVTLNASAVDGSLVINSATNTPYLKVVCGAKVTGAVTFVGKPGIVQMTDDGDVQGKINNGEIQFINMNCDDKMA